MPMKLPADGTELEASMRPRQHGRGECSSTPPGRSRRTCFNAATAAWPWRMKAWGRSGVPAKVLQCGHGSMAVENAPCYVHGDGVTVALQCGHGSMAVENA